MAAKTLTVPWKTIVKTMYSDDPLGTRERYAGALLTSAWMEKMIAAVESMSMGVYRRPETGELIVAIMPLDDPSLVLLSIEEAVLGLRFEQRMVMGIWN